MNSNLRSTTIKPRSGRTPMVGRSAAKTPFVLLSSPQRETNVLTAKQKLQQLDNLGNNYSRGAFESWMQTFDSDEEEVQPEVQPKCPPSAMSTASCASTNLQLQFDSVGTTTNAEAESNDWDYDASDIPECIVKIREAMSVHSEWSKLRKDKLEAEHRLQSNEIFNFDAMIAEIEKNVMPALKKLVNESQQFREMIRKDPPAAGVLQCNIEEQKSFVEYVTHLSDDCRQLSDLEIDTNDLYKQTEFLRELADLVDSKMNSKAAEKLKLKRMEKLLNPGTNGTESSKS